MTESAGDCNANPAASKDTLGPEIPELTKDKAHCFSLVLAQQHGEEAAVILQGLGYKVAKSTKKHDGRKWYYDPLRVLEKRWPDLTDSGIHGIIERQVKSENVFKDRFNKQWWRDRTTWYSVKEELQKLALKDEGKIWFDVPAAVKSKSIVAGTLYHNLRYQLLLFLAENSSFEGVPYHRVNKTALSRALPWSLSTINREFDELEKLGMVAQNPKKRGEYTVLVPSDLIVPDTMKKNVSSVEKRIVSSTEKTMSSAEMIVSSTEKIVSSADNITHYKTIGKPIHKHHSLPAPPVVVGECPNAADAAKGSGHDKLSDDTINVTPGSMDTTGSSASAHHDINAPTVPVAANMSLEQLRDRISTLKDQLTDSDIPSLRNEINGLTNYIASEDLPLDILRAGYAARTPETVIAAVAGHVWQLMHEHGGNVGWSTDEQEYAALRSTLMLTAAFLVATQGWNKVQPEFKPFWNPIWDTYMALPEVGDHPGATADERAGSLLRMIQRSNEDGWPTYAGEDLKYKVPASTSVRKAAVEFFEDNLDALSHDAWKTLSDCIEVHEKNTVPEGYDPLWHARRGVKPAFLFKFWDDIRAEIDAVEILSN